MNNIDINKTENSGKDFEMSTSSAITKEDWMSKKWRPMMGWVYMSTCSFDFVIAPILWSILQAYSGGAVTSQWMPLTLQGAGLYHVAMGAVLGLTAFGRTQEKIAGASNVPAIPSRPLPTPSIPSTPSRPARMEEPAL
jgi:hypothetical protein